MLNKFSRILACKSLFSFCRINASGKNIAAVRNLSITSTRLEEKKINVDGIDINYLKTGAGSHPVLLLPGAVGTIWTDYKPQIEGLNKSEFTIVAWDPPGYGKSRPPEREFPADFFERDAKYAYNLMKMLGFAEFSLVGWSDGGITSLILAANYPQSVQKMVVHGSNAFILPHEMKIYESTKNIDTWSERMRAPLIAIYGEEYFRKTWTAWVEAMDKIYKNNNGDICKNSVSKIKCPTLIVHGKKDVLERKVNVKGVDINYIKTGAGKQTIFLLTSTLGSIWTDFKPQIEGLNKEKFTIIAWDPPGYGKSRPPDRDCSGDHFARDADYAYELMKTLGFSKYSLVGWSGGGITSIIAASKYPQCIEKLVLESTGFYVTADELVIYQSMRDIKNWSEKMKGPLIAIYGEDYVTKVWASWLDSMVDAYENKNGDLCSEHIFKVKCPTLIIQGRKDVIVYPKHAVVMNEIIRNSRLKIFEDGGHNVHLKYPDEFNKLITDFFLEEN
ncbi:GSCOCG00004178001-RA-CDS [Cotesia congregata]|nr:GSCOCG00004178001-RA-CDS [Cotesia congregata]